MLSARVIRTHPSRAPRILLSSKEFIDFGLPEWARDGTGWVATEVPAAADRYRFACALATRISATITAKYRPLAVRHSSRRAGPVPDNRRAHSRIPKS